MVAECEPSPIAEHSTLADQSGEIFVDRMKVFQAEFDL